MGARSAVREEQVRRLVAAHEAVSDAAGNADPDAPRETIVPYQQASAVLAAAMRNSTQEEIAQAAREATRRGY